MSSVSTVATGNGNGNGMSHKHDPQIIEEQHEVPSSSGSMTLPGGNERGSSSGSNSPGHTEHANTSLDAEDAERKDAITELARAMTKSSDTCI